jgi:hypothetical protein
VRALTIQQPWLWAIVRGGKNPENRANRKGQRAAKAQFNHPGPLLLHSGQRYAGEEAYRTVRRLATVDPGHPGGPRSETAWAFGSFVASAVLESVHTAEECEDLERGRFCSPWAEPNAAHLQFTGIRELTRPIPHPGALGLWKVTDTTVLAEVRRQFA